MDNPTEVEQDALASSQSSEQSPKRRVSRTFKAQKFLEETPGQDLVAPSENAPMDEASPAQAMGEERPKRRAGRKQKASLPAVFPDDSQNDESQGFGEAGNVPPPPPEEDAPLDQEQYVITKTKRGRKARISAGPAAEGGVFSDAPGAGGEEIIGEEPPGKVHRKRVPKASKQFIEVPGEKPVKKRGRPKKRDSYGGIEGQFDGAEIGDAADGADPNAPVKKKRGRKSNAELAAKRIQRMVALPPAQGGFADMEVYMPSEFDRTTAQIGALLTYTEVANLIKTAAQFAKEPRAGVTLAQYLADANITVKAFKRPEDIHRMLAFMAYGKENVILTPELLDQAPVDLSVLANRVNGPDYWTATDRLENLKLWFFTSEVLQNQGIKQGISDTATLEQRWKNMSLVEKQNLEKMLLAATGAAQQ